MKKKILVAMSGGVDSSVAAALLLEEGHEVGGATIRTWASNTCADKNTKTCCGISGVEDAREVADSLGIPYWVFNFEEEFKKHVVDHFASEYRKGRTPNPCISCNEHIKFRLFLNRARQLGYDAIATGHYAQVSLDPFSGRYFIEEGKDAHKDQSYVLFPLEQEILKSLYLPVGGFAKTEIRQKAREKNLSVVMNKPDSQEICFIPSNDYGTFLEKEYTNGPQSGNIILKNGTVLGRHSGYFHYTRGQRHGLGVAYSERLYVLETRPDTNEVIVGTKEEVFGQSFEAARVNWFVPPSFETEFRAQVKIRSQHTKTWAQVFPEANGDCRIVFEESQDAITPGQAAVIYDGSRVLGGGWIK